MRKSILYLLFFVLSFEYASTWVKIYPDEITRPFLYRQLVPALVELIPLGEYLSLFLVQTFFCVGIGAVMLYLYERNFYKTTGRDILLVAAFVCVIGLLSFTAPIKKEYDAPTAFFFTLIFALWIEKKYTLTIPLFALACLNKETAILIVPVLFLLSVKWHIVTYQVLVWIGINIITHEVFSGYDGSSAWVRPVENILAYTGNLDRTIPLVLVAIFTMVMFVKNSTRQFKTFMLLLPALFVLHMVMGYPYEIRVFAEVAPLLFLGAFMKGVNNEEEKESEKGEVGEIPAMWNAEKDMLPR